MYYHTTHDDNSSCDSVIGDSTLIRLAYRRVIAIIEMGQKSH
jgi:hypothetical protein